MRERIDQVVSLFYDPEKDTTEVVLANGKGLVGQLIEFPDGNKALIVPDRRYGQPRIARLIDISGV